MTEPGKYKHKILIVEDDSLAGEDLCYQLEHIGYEVPDIVPSARRALQAVDEYHPDLILMDVFLEGDVDGIQAAAQIQERWDVPIVFMSIYSDSAVLERAKITKPFGYIVKPYTERELLAVLSMALYKADTQSKMRESSVLSGTMDSMGAILIRTNGKGDVQGMNAFAELALGAVIENARGKLATELVVLRDPESGENIPLDRYVNDILNGQLSWLRKRDLMLVRASKPDTFVDLTICANATPKGSRGVAIMLQTNDLPNMELDNDSDDSSISGSNIGQSKSSADKFIGTVSHDLRAPLGELQRYAACLELESDGELESAAGEVKAECLSMQRLIQDLVIYMRLGRGKLPLARVDLDSILETSLNDLAGKVRDSGAEVDVATALPVVHAHSATLVHLLSQLLRNALTFIPVGKKPRIRVWAETVNQQVRIWIEDSGQKLSTAQQGHAFGLFQQMSSAGPGIGLAIVQRAAAWMGGSAGVEDNEGSGNRFWVNLPLAESGGK